MNELALLKRNFGSSVAHRKGIVNVLWSGPTLSLGTVSDRYYYDRLKGRDLPESKRTRRPWELPAETKK